ncbi:hypothetical protein Poly30_06870 [Planctomycetes bacterium Poly30]|uniref:DUF1772 domain-containing protein n=1 Tax=Saltatorellus ferox TaxID=2528018 RepID=A0A518EM90_9BACT|nr:hypothetical protein Poly30_06870 [Planctomycetes bacterium Poly30]
MAAAWILISHAAVTWAMVGLIWTIQVVHYPLFAYVKSGFRQYHEQHMHRITFVVGPLMLAELAGSVYLWLHPPAGTDARLWLAALLLLGIAWVDTGLFSVPQHGRLESGGFDVAAHRGLMISNLVRTLAWTARGLLIAWLVVRWASALQSPVSGA